MPRADILYVVNEMQSTVVTYAYDAANGTLSELQTVSALPKGFARAGGRRKLKYTLRANFFLLRIAGTTASRCLLSTRRTAR